MKYRHFLIIELILSASFFVFYLFYLQAINKELILIKNDFAPISLSEFDKLIIYNYGQHKHGFNLFLVGTVMNFLSIFHLFLTWTKTETKFLFIKLIFFNLFFYLRVIG
jgi:hypothetical protein